MAAQQAHTLTAVEKGVTRVEELAQSAVDSVQALEAQQPQHELKWKQAIEEEANTRMTDSGYVRRALHVVVATRVCLTGRVR